MFRLFILISFLFVISHQQTQKPNIVIILADDLGWNDVGFQGSNQIPTPNLDALAYSGVILKNHYVTPVCTPTRAALMTGRNPIHNGMWNNVILSFEPWGLSTDEKLLPQYLKQQGYATYIVGKWHLGFFEEKYTPTFRGFDSHFGYWSGQLDYYNHSCQQWVDPMYVGFDMRRGTNVHWETMGEYTTSMFTREAIEVINAHDTSQPMFLYLPHHAVHSANSYEPMQAPQEVIDEFLHIEDPNRRIFAAMVTMLDRSVGSVVTALAARGILENTIIIFSSDNGGAAGGFGDRFASNWPLRGSKDTVWEGGVRTPAFIWSPLLRTPPRIATQFSHVQDWLPTLLSAIDAEHLLNNTQLDGQDVWDAINDPEVPTYDDVLLHLDNVRNYAAVRQGNWKILTGTTWDGSYDSWYEPSGREGEYNITQVQESESALAISITSRPLPSLDVILQMREQIQINCNLNVTGVKCDPLVGDVCLFNLENDPCETNNLAASHPDEFATLQAVLQRYNDTIVPYRNQPLDPASNPANWNNTWIPWKDEIPATFKH